LPIKIYTVDVSPKEDVKGDICLYVVDNGEYLTLVEAGPSNGYIRFLNWLEENGFKTDDIKYVLLTHIHLDHGGASGYIARDNSGVTIYVHPKGYPHLIDPSKLWRASLDTIGYVAEVYGEPIPVPKENLVTPEDNEIIDIGEDRFKILYTPGHASHHMSIYLEGERILFTGDSLGLYHGGTVIPTSPKPHNVPKSIESIMKMRSLQPRKLGFTHFGMSDDAVKMIEKYEIVYRKWVKVVEEGYKMGKDITEIYRELKAEDLYINIQERFFRSRGYGEEEVLFSLYGIYSYFEWMDMKSREGS